MKNLVIISMLFLSSSTFALEINDHSRDGGNISQGQLQGQIQGQGQAQSTMVDVSNRISNDVRTAASAYVATNNASVAGGGAAVATGGGVNIDMPAGVAAFGLGSMYPSAPCMGTSQLGGGNPFFNIGVGTSWESTECQIRETARSFSGMGKTEDAIAVLCASSYAAVAPSCIKAQAKE